MTNFLQVHHGPCSVASLSATLHIFATVLNANKFLIVISVWLINTYRSHLKINTLYRGLKETQHLIIKTLGIRALASARGSVARRAQRPSEWTLEGPKGPRVSKTCESEGPRTSRAKCPSWRLPVLLYVFVNSTKNRDFHDSVNIIFWRPKYLKILVVVGSCNVNIV